MSTRQYIAVIKENAACHDSMRSNPENYKVNGEICWDRVMFYEFVNRFNKKDEFCLGKMPINPEIGIPFFENENTQKIFEEYVPRIISKKDLKDIIDLYREMILNSYKEILESGEDAWHLFMQDKIKEWTGSYSKPYILDGRKEMVNCYDDELQFWDLVRMYKQIDWDDPRTKILFYQW